MTTDLKIGSKYGSVLFPCTDRISLRIMSHLAYLSSIVK